MKIFKIWEWKIHKKNKKDSQITEISLYESLFFRIFYASPPKYSEMQNMRVEFMVRWLRNTLKYWKMQNMRVSWSTSQEKYTLKIQEIKNLGVIHKHYIMADLPWNYNYLKYYNHCNKHNNLWIFTMILPTYGVFMVDIHLYSL